jgi:hypothetical protein
MPLFQISKGRLTAVAQANFIAEKFLQSLIEANLRVVFNCRLVASEHARDLKAIKPLIERAYQRIGS